VSFPEDHPLYQGNLPMTIAGVSEQLTGHDLVVVIGAPVFRYYPFVPGRHLPEGTELLHVTCDPDTAAYANSGDSLLGDAKLTIDLLIDKVDSQSGRVAPTPLSWPHRLPSSPSTPLTPAEAYAALHDVRPSDAVVVNESTSTMAVQAEWPPTVRSGSFFTGFGCRAAHAETADDVRSQFKLATEADGPTVIVVPTQPQYAKLG
jgi:benzoylformate decarboxylase